MSIDGTRLKMAQPIIKQGRAPLSELGESGLMHARGEIYEQPLQQLMGTRAKRIWKEMSRYDDIVGAVLTAIEMLIRGVAWRVEPAGEDEANAEFLESMIDDMSHSWGDFIADVLSMLPYGFSYFEIVLKRRQGEQAQPGRSSRYTDGRLGIRKLAGRAQDTIGRWLIDEDGGISGAYQQPQTTGGEIFLPIDRCLLFRTTVRKNNPEGRSVLENAYISWFAKKRIQQYEWIRTERDATGVPVAWVPPELLRSDASAEDAALLASIQRIVRDIKFNEQAGVVMPLAFDPDGHKLYELELMASPGQRPQQTGPIIDRLDRRIAMTTLTDVIMIGHEGVGSFALASSKTNLLSTALGAYLDVIQDVLNRHLVPRLFRWNGIQTTDGLPQFRHGDIEAVDMTELADYIQKISMAGAPLFPSADGELERYLLENAGLPAPSEEDMARQIAEREADRALMREMRERASFSSGEAEDEGEDETAEGG